MGTVLRRLLSRFRQHTIDRDLAEEIASHKADLQAALEADGHSPQEAARLAAVRFGGARQVRERAGDEWQFAFIASFGRDLRLAARSLRRRPGFAAAAIATLALGIGTSTAIFSVAYGVALRPLPYADPDRLVRIYEVNPSESAGSRTVSDATFHAWRTDAPAIESAARFMSASAWALANAPDAPTFHVMLVSPAFFDVLGVRPILGSGFHSEATSSSDVRDIVLSYGAYRRLFGDRTDIENFEVAFDKAGRNRVLGVMPASFAFDEPVDGWRAESVPLPIPRIIRGWRYGRVVARLKPGVTLEQTAHDVAAVSAALGRQFPKTNEGWTASVEPLRSAVAGSFGRATVFLLAAVAVVLLVACFNVGSLLMARAVSRDRETAVRISLGAGSADLLRLWLAEAVMLGVAGASVGVLLAGLGVSALKSAAPPFVPRLDAIRLDGPAFLMAVGGLVVAIVIFTIVLAGRSSARPSLGRGAAGPTSVGDDPRRMRLRMLLLIAQCSGAAVLVVLAVMLTRSVSKLLATDLGWQPAHVISLTADPPVTSRRPWFQYVQWSDDVLRGLRTTPGVRDAAVSSQVPLSGATNAETVARGRGKPDDDGRRWPATWHRVTDGYFSTMGVRLVEGRGFESRDRFSEKQMTAEAREDRATEGVAIITLSVARSLWPNQSPIGQYVWQPDLENLPRQVIGVVDDITVRNIGEENTLNVFMPWTQASGSPKLLVRAEGDVTVLVPAIRSVLQSVSAGTRVDQIVTLDELVRRTTAQPRFTSKLVALFGASALLLAAVGIYGTQWYLVGIRTREIGVRLALGAPRRLVVSTVLRAGLAPAFVGAAIGLAVAAILGRLFSALFFGLATVDVTSLAIGAACLIGAAIAAAIGPALRAGRVDPMTALRAD
jgi:predicted permease